MKTLHFSKPIVILVAIVIALLVLASCSSNSTTTSTSTTTTTKTTTTTTTTTTQPTSTTPSTSTTTTTSTTTSGSTTTTSPTTTTTTTSPTTSTTTTTTTTTGQNVVINLVAQGMAFNMSTIVVSAGGRVTINFDNKDSVPHNFALYTDSSAQTMIFQGQVVTGNTITYTFTAPSTPGTYFFRCDVHPAIMTGSFIVQ